VSRSSPLVDVDHRSRDPGYVLVAQFLALLRCQKVTQKFSDTVAPHVVDERQSDGGDVATSALRRLSGVVSDFIMALSLRLPSVRLSNSRRPPGQVQE